MLAQAKECRSSWVEAIPSISLMAVIGVLRDGQTIVLAVKTMCGETEVAWRAVL